VTNNIKVGPAGWSYEDWKGVVYPSPRPRGFHEAEYLTRFFPIIEINTSFYRPPRRELSQLWVNKVAGQPDFQFTAKLYRAFTHERILNKHDVSAYRDGIAPLVENGRLGCLLMQFPWSFRYSGENQQYLRRLKQTFRDYPLVAELRHASWNSEEALSVLIENEIGFANIDQPHLHHCFPATDYATSSIGYVRLHGRNYHEWFNFQDDASRTDGLTSVQARYNYLYSPAQLNKWSQRIRRVADQTTTTFVVTNNHFQGKAIVNALQLMDMVSGDRVSVPPKLLDRYPELQSIARNAPAQRSLFLVPPTEHPQQLAS
jgi:uncharacterized protein YecE (DUF72 family)